MGTIENIRRDNLRLIIDKYHGGVAGKLAAALDKQPNQIYRILSDNPNSRRNAGTALVREIEEHHSLPEGWMDTPHQKDGPFTLEDQIPLAKLDYGELRELIEDRRITRKTRIEMIKILADSLGD